LVGAIVTQSVTHPIAWGIASGLPADLAGRDLREDAAMVELGDDMAKLQRRLTNPRWTKDFDAAVHQAVHLGALGDQLLADAP
jgi:hypothetical protein